MKLLGNIFFSQQVIPSWYANKVNGTLKEQYKKFEKFSVADFQADTNVEKEIEIFESKIKDQSERKKGLEEKAKSILFGVTLSITAITFSLGYEKPTFRDLAEIGAVVILFLSIIYIVASAIYSVLILKPQTFHGVDLSISMDKDAKIFSLVKRERKALLKELIQSKFLNDNINLRISNRVYAAVMLLRNGILLFAVYFIVAFTAKNFASKKTTPAKSNVTIKVNDSLSILLSYSFDLEATGRNFHLNTDSARVITTTLPQIQKKGDTTNGLKR